MAEAPLRPCLVNACPQVTRNRPPYCDGHQARGEQARQRRVDARRGSSHARGYDWNWRKPGGIRDRFLAKHLVCERCLPVKTLATDVDHRDGNPRNNADENLRALCHACHSRRTAVDQGFARARARR